jgi:hypothetical protein
VKANLLNRPSIERIREVREDARAIILGMVLGDGHVSRDARYMTATIIVKHSEKQRPYAEYKARLIADVLGGVVPSVRVIDNNGYPGCVFKKTHVYLRSLRDWIYTEDKKVLSPHIKWLTPQGLAIWYMDDGGLGYKRRNGKVHATALYINCHTDLDEADRICAEVEKRFGITFRPNLNNGKYRLYCGTREARRFSEIVAPFMHSSMAYKIAIP